MKRLVLVLVVAGLASGACINGAPSGDGTSSSTGVKGRVLIGPTCPVERADSPCPDKPIEGVVVALRRIGEAAGNVHTDSNGRFFLPLAPGGYLIYAREESDNPRVSKFQRVTIAPGRVLSLALVVDSGIR